MTYRLCERIIKGRLYESADQMLEKLKAFAANNRITVEQEKLLTDLLKQVEQ